MQKNDNLIRLVGSLSLKDKRNFKLFLKKYDIKNSKYGTLYNLIIKDTSQSEEDIKELYIKETKDKNYSNTKFYLERKIIESLGTADRKNCDIIKECNILIERGLINLAYEHAKTIKPSNNGLDKINCLTIKRKILTIKHNLGQFSSSELTQVEKIEQVERKLQIELDELRATTKMNILYTKHGKNITQKTANATHNTEFALQSIKNIKDIDGTDFSDEFNFRKYIILINIARQIADIDLLQKFSVPLIHYWKNGYSGTLSLAQIYASMMTAYIYSDNEDTLEKIKLLETFVKNHPKTSDLEKKNNK